MMKLVLLLSLSLFANVALSQQTYYGVTAGNGYGIRFWNHDAYKIHMGYGSEYFYGPVSDYSIKMNMDGYPGRGWVWGGSGQTPIAGLNNLGQMQIAGTFTPGGIRIPNRFGFGQSESAIEIEVPADSYNAIRGYNGSQHIGTIHFFDDTWQSGATVSSAGSINLDPVTAVTLGTWNNPAAYFRKSDGFVGIGATNPHQKLHVQGDVLGAELAILVENLNTNSTSFAPVQFKTGASSNVWQAFARNGDFTVGVANVADHLVIKDGGNVGIGTTTPDSKLTVKGTIHTQEVKVDINGAVAPDYVFEKDYPLTSLEELKTYIDQNKHLPEIPSAKEMEENGINLKEMNLLLLRKVEELTLYIIKQQGQFEQERKLNMERYAELQDAAESQRALIGYLLNRKIR